jgi:hypothetical protein
LKSPDTRRFRPELKRDVEMVGVVGASTLRERVEISSRPLEDAYPVPAQQFVQPFTPGPLVNPVISKVVNFVLAILAQRLHLLKDCRQVVVLVFVIANMNEAGGCFYHNQPWQARGVDDRAKNALLDRSALTIRNNGPDSPMTSILFRNVNLESQVPASRVRFGRRPRGSDIQSVGESRLHATHYVPDILVQKITSVTQQARYSSLVTARGIFSHAPGPVNAATNQAEEGADERPVTSDSFEKFLTGRNLEEL